jgi:hypothetical protein
VRCWFLGTSGQNHTKDGKADQMAQGLQVQSGSSPHQ